MGRTPIRLKAMRIVDSSFDPQYGKSLVVHFDRVFFDPVFDAQTFRSASEIAADFSLEVAIEAAAEKTQYLSAVTDQHGVLQQAGIKPRQ